MGFGLGAYKFYAYKGKYIMLAIPLNKMISRK